MTETVFIVDDDPAMRESLVTMLETAGFQCEAYADGPAFLARFSPERPGCLILDLAMPEMSGIQVQEALNAREARIPIIFLTGHGTVSLAVQAVKDGAVDFLEKPVSGPVLLDKVRTYLSLDREQRRKRAVAEDLGRTYQQLSPREKEVMAGIVRGLSNKEIARELNLSPRTVEVHRRNLMYKMGATSLADLLRMAGVIGLESQDADTT